MYAQGGVRTKFGAIQDSVIKKNPTPAVLSPLMYVREISVKCLSATGKYPGSMYLLPLNAS